MIDPKSLRIGNYIISNREYFDKPTLGRVYQISASNIFIEYTEDNGEIRGISNPLHVLSGIPLSEQELIRLGFQYAHEGSTVLMLMVSKEKQYLPSSLQFSYDNYIQICRSGINAYSVKCDFVHQLQNLFYALCGQELTYK